MSKFILNNSDSSNISELEALDIVVWQYTKTRLLDNVPVTAQYLPPDHPALLQQPWGGSHLESRNQTFLNTQNFQNVSSLEIDLICYSSIIPQS